MKSRAHDDRSIILALCLWAVLTCAAALYVLSLPGCDWGLGFCKRHPDASCCSVVQPPDDSPPTDDEDDEG